LGQGNTNLIKDIVGHGEPPMGAICITLLVTQSILRHKCGIIGGPFDETLTLETETSRLCHRDENETSRQDGDVQQFA